MKLTGRVAPVTGASRGIGRAIAMRLAHDGAAVAVTAEAAGSADAPINTAFGPAVRKDVRDNERVMIDDVPVAAALFERARPFLPPRLGWWEAAQDHERQGYKVWTEGQNLFALKGRSGTLSGKPDVVAVKDDAGWIVDMKTGTPRASDRVQVMIYMWALPRTNPAFAGATFDGKVVYKTGYTVVSAGEIDEVFVRRVGELMKEICGDREPHKAPSYGECLHCPVTPEDCGDRVSTDKAYQGETDEF